MSAPPEPEHTPGPLPWERNATEDLWQRTLHQIPTTLGKLAYLARLRNPETERYEHHGLRAAFGEEAAESAMRSSHLVVLEEWLKLELLEEKADLEQYVDSLPQSRKRTISSWLKTSHYLLLMPLTASESQTLLFGANMRVILESLRLGVDVDPVDRESSPHP